MQKQTDLKLTLHRFELPLRHTFTIARSSATIAKILIVELEQDELRGYGEAPESNYYGAGLATLTGQLEKARPLIESRRLDDPTVFWQEMHPALSQAPFAHCALDQAAHDLWGKQRGQPVWKLWGLDPARAALTDYTLGIDRIEVMVAKMKEFPDWPIYKIKLGRPNDIEIMQALRRETRATLRVDANAAWTTDEAIRKSVALKELGVEFIEQPLATDDWEGMKKVYRESALPVIADETCRVESDVERCRNFFHGINIKLPKCGGLTPARRMIARARELDLKVMVGCFTESSVGISAAAQLLPLLDYADLDGALLLARDVADGVTFANGKVNYPKENGCGVRMKSAAGKP